MWARLRFSLLLILFLCPGMSRTEDNLSRGFADPPPSARTRAFWWWLNGNVTKAAITLTDPQAVAEVFDQLEHAALSGRRGPVWLDVPLDVQAAQVNPATLRRAQLPVAAEQADVSAAVAQTVALLHQAH